MTNMFKKNRYKMENFNINVELIKSTKWKFYNENNTLF